MNWLDIVLISVLVGIALVQAIRGFGPAVIDALCLYGALYLTSTQLPNITHHVMFRPNPEANNAFAFGAIFFVTGTTALGIARFLHGATQIHLGMFEHLLGLVAGIAAGLIVGHAIVQGVTLGDPTLQASGAIVANGQVAQEVLTFQTYHSTLDTLAGACTSHREMPDLTK